MYPDCPNGDLEASKLMMGAWAFVASICRIVCPGAKKGDRVYLDVS
jgi:hypothetical protein